MLHTKFQRLLFIGSVNSYLIAKEGVDKDFDKYHGDSYWTNRLTKCKADIKSAVFNTGAYADCGGA